MIVLKSRVFKVGFSTLILFILLCVRSFFPLHLLSKAEQYKEASTCRFFSRNNIESSTAPDLRSAHARPQLAWFHDIAASIFFKKKSKLPVVCTDGLPSTATYRRLSFFLQGSGIPSSSKMSSKALSFHTPQTPRCTGIRCLQKGHVVVNAAWPAGFTNVRAHS